MSLFAAIALWACAWVGVAAIARSPAGARLSLPPAFATLSLPWMVLAHDSQRVVLAFAALLLAMSAVDFAAGRRPGSFAGRLRYSLAFAALVDASSAVRAHPRFDSGAAWHAGAALAAAIVAMACWIAVSGLPDLVRVPIRLAAAAACVLAAAELNSEIVRLMSAAGGVRLAAVHAHPYRSRTITEFWSRRWNLLAARWFRDYAFLPLRRRSLALAPFALFGLSAALHAYLVAPLGSLEWMAMCAVFFLAQPVLIAAERHLGVGRWPPRAARLWTFTMLVALLPLLLAPLFAGLRLDL